MSEQARNKDVVRTYLKALGRADAEDVGATLAEDAVVIAIGTSFMSGSRTKAEVVSTVDLLGSITQNGIDFEVLHLTAEDDRVSAEVKGTSTLVNGTPYNQEYHFLFHFRDGLIVRLMEYFCTKRTEESFGPILAGAQN